MMTRNAVFGLFAGIFLVIVTLIGVAMVTPPRAETAPVLHGVLVSCPVAEVSLDQGYGVTRTALRAICSNGQPVQPNVALSAAK
jgi:hypothetical protein